MKFRKKPVVIEAIQWSRVILDEVVHFIASSESKVICRVPFDDPEAFEIETLEGTMRASKGDWIIKGVKGEFYPCKPDIFEATYEAVEEA